MLLEFHCYRGSKMYAAGHRGRLFVVRRLGQKRYEAAIHQLGREIVKAPRRLYSIGQAQAWLEGEARKLARQALAARNRTPIVSAIEKGRS